MLGTGHLEVKFAMKVRLDCKPYEQPAIDWSLKADARTPKKRLSPIGAIHARSPQPEPGSGWPGPYRARREGNKGCLTQLTAALGLVGN